MFVLKFDEERLKEKETWGSTGMYVRGQLPDGSWASEDIVMLTKESLLHWLQSRGGNNPWAEDVVGILLGHGHLHALDTVSK